jgi:hypothetical protein
VKAIRLEKPGHYAQVQIDEPQKPAAGEALVRVLRVGICGTDVSGFLGKMPFYSYPRIPGHELGVEVLDVGPGVTNVKPGQRCAVEPYLNCQECRACLAGRGNCCESLKVLGVDRRRPPAPVRPPAASSTRPATSPDALRSSDARHRLPRRRTRRAAEGEEVLVDAGPIGLAAMQFAKIRGARLTVLDVNPRRLEFAKQEMTWTTRRRRHRKRQLDGAFPVVIARRPRGLNRPGVPLRGPDRAARLRGHRRRTCRSRPAVPAEMTVFASAARFRPTSPRSSSSCRREDQHASLGHPRTTFSATSPTSRRRSPKRA